MFAGHHKYIAWLKQSMGFRYTNTAKSKMHLLGGKICQDIAYVEEQFKFIIYHLTFDFVECIFTPIFNVYLCNTGFCVKPLCQCLICHSRSLQTIIKNIYNDLKLASKPNEIIQITLQSCLYHSVRLKRHMRLKNFESINWYESPAIACNCMTWRLKGNFYAVK